MAEDLKRPSVMNYLTRIRQSMTYDGTDWPPSGAINALNALRCIEREMKTWNELPALKHWMFYVKFLEMKADCTTDYFTYLVLWSVPTPAYPEPQVTVSVFFSVAASRVDPPTTPAEVTYVFEGKQFVHRLEMVFRPKWLYDILDMKTMMFKTFKF